MYILYYVALHEFMRVLVFKYGKVWLTNYWWKTAFCWIFNLPIKNCPYIEKNECKCAYTPEFN